MIDLDRTALVEWLVEVGLLKFYPACHRPDRTHGPAWVLKRPYYIDGDSCEAWSAVSAEKALASFLEGRKG